MTEYIEYTHDSLTKEQRLQNIKTREQQLKGCKEKYYQFILDDLNYQIRCLKEYHD